MARGASAEEDASRAKKLILSSRARQDLAELHLWISEHDVAGNTDGVVEMLQDHLERFARLGLSGTSQKHLAPGLRFSNHNGFNFYFLIEGRDLTVVRIVRGRRDTRRLKFTDEP